MKLSFILLWTFVFASLLIISELQDVNRLNREIVRNYETTISNQNNLLDSNTRLIKEPTARIVEQELTIALLRWPIPTKE